MQCIIKGTNPLNKVSTYAMHISVHANFYICKYINLACHMTTTVNEKSRVLNFYKAKMSCVKQR